MGCGGSKEYPPQKRELDDTHYMGMGGGLGGGADYYMDMMNAEASEDSGRKSKMSPQDYQLRKSIFRRSKRDSRRRRRRRATSPWPCENLFRQPSTSVHSQQPCTSACDAAESVGRPRVELHCMQASVRLTRWPGPADGSKHVDQAERAEPRDELNGFPHRLQRPQLSGLGLRLRLYVCKKSDGASTDCTGTQRNPGETFTNRVVQPLW